MLMLTWLLTPIQSAFLVKRSSNLEHLHRNTWKILTRKAASFALTDRRDTCWVQAWVVAHEDMCTKHIVQFRISCFWESLITSKYSSWGIPLNMSVIGRYIDARHCGFKTGLYVFKIARSGSLSSCIYNIQRYFDARHVEWHGTVTNLTIQHVQWFQFLFMCKIGT